jgi:hypothetical protein
MPLYGALEVPWPPVTGIFAFVYVMDRDRGVETTNVALVAAAT